jgi:hypothetical protein
VQTFDWSEIIPPADEATTQTMYVIVYPDSCKEEVVEILDAVGVPGYTETQKVVGRGQRGRHFDNAIWPGADGMIYVVVDPTQGRALATALTDYSRSLEMRTRGLSGLHVFMWQCAQLL